MFSRRRWSIAFAALLLFAAFATGYCLTVVTPSIGAAYVAPDTGETKLWTFGFVGDTQQGEALVPTIFRRMREADVAIRYARAMPAEGVAEELLSDRFYAVCSPTQIGKGFKSVADLRGKVLVHSWWSPTDNEAPTWQRWLRVAQQRWRNAPNLSSCEHLSFREELHAIEAVIAGQGIGLFSDVLVKSELDSGLLVKAFDLSLPGYQFFVVRRSSHARSRIVRAFSSWLQSVK